jgi:hypothetical protein
LHLGTRSALSTKKIYFLVQTSWGTWYGRKWSSSGNETGAVFRNDTLLKVKVSLGLSIAQWGGTGGSAEKSSSILTSPLDRDERTASRSGHFASCLSSVRGPSGIHLIRSWVGHNPSIDGVLRSKMLLHIIVVVEPVKINFADWNISK